MTMYTQFEKQFSDVLREHLATFKVSDHRDSEETLLSYIRGQLDSLNATLNPVLLLSNKSHDLAAAHVEAAKYLVNAGAYNDSLSELCEAIRNTTDTSTLLRVLSIRVVVSSSLELHHELSSDLQLMKDLSLSDIHPIFSLFNEHNLCDNKIILRTFHPTSTFTLDDFVVHKFDEIQEKVKLKTDYKNNSSLHNRARQFQPLDLKSGEAEYLSDSVKVERSAEKGRHVVATQHLNIGDIITVEVPTVHILLSERWSTHCQHCLNFCRAPLPCLRCPDVVYCSTNCLENDTSHQIQCGFMSEIGTLPKMIYLALQTIVTFKSDIIKQTAGEETSQNFTRTMDLITNFEHRTPFDLIRRSCLSIFLTNVLKQLRVFEDLTGDMNVKHDNDVMSRDHDVIPRGMDGFQLKRVYETVSCVVLKCLQSYPCNVHEVAELHIKPEFRYSANEDIGAGAFPFLSMINHSCNPNVVRHSIGTKNVLRALRRIEVGEEVVDNYGYHYATHTIKERQKCLKSQYLFSCGCVACSRPGAWPLFPALPSLPAFRCRNCVASLPRPHLKCGKCGKKYAKVAQRYDILAGNASKFVAEFVKDGKLNNNSQSVKLYLSFAEQWTSPPYRQYNESQEAYKQIVNLQSNHLQL